MEYTRSNNHYICWCKALQRGTKPLAITQGSLRSFRTICKSYIRLVYWIEFRCNIELSSVMSSTKLPTQQTKAWKFGTQLEGGFKLIKADKHLHERSSLLLHHSKFQSSLGRQEFNVECFQLWNWRNHWKEQKNLMFWNLLNR